MRDELKKIEKTAGEEMARVNNLDGLAEWKIKYLGREKGALTLILRNIKNLAASERKEIGEAANKLRTELEEKIAKKSEELKKNETELVLKKEWLDVTRPFVRKKQGGLHPLTLIRREVEKIFYGMGFSVAEGPEIETEWYNFDALNIPADHPARDMWDTFWLKQSAKSGLFARPDLRSKSGLGQKLLLRTHTSPVQIRYMQKHNPPIRIVAPGRVYRYEATDASHEIQFYQFEGLMVEKNVSVANFKAVMLEFFRRFFGSNTKIRLRPSFFPFVEPGFEVDMSCVMCSGKGCPVCKKKGWLEMAGAGMVHPKVFEAVGYVPGNQQGFAFGMSLDRPAMMKYKIPDIRLFHSGDLRFLKQFRV